LLNKIWHLLPPYRMVRFFHEIRIC
jgi:hypothetical protein